MAKKKREGKKYSYMDTYGDLVTLLLCFFVLLFAMSTVEEVKYNAFVEALSSRFGNTPPTNISFVSPDDTSASGSELGNAQQTGDVMEQDQTLPADLSQLNQAITKFIEENGMQGEVSVEKNENGTTFIRLTDNLLFEGNSDVINRDALPFLDFLSECFNTVQDQILQVKFNGHTASVEGSTVDDWNLSATRAGNVASYVANTGQFNRFKIYFSGYARNYPIADNATSEGRAKNRRVDIIVLSKESASLEATMADLMRVYFPEDNTEFFQGDAGDIPGAVNETIVPVDSGDATLAGLTESELAALTSEAASTPAEPAPAASSG